MKKFFFLSFFLSFFLLAKINSKFEFTKIIKEKWNKFTNNQKNGTKMSFSVLIGLIFYIILKNKNSSAYKKKIKKNEEIICKFKDKKIKYINEIVFDFKQKINILISNNSNIEDIFNKIIKLKKEALEEVLKDRYLWKEDKEELKKSIDSIVENLNIVKYENKEVL